MTVTRLLLALDFLHTEARVIHGVLKTDNVMLSIEDDGMLADSAKAEKSRKFRRPDKAKGYGLPTLCDFGESRIGASQESDPFVQPHIYRAPEVMFDMPWGSAADIWNLAGLVSTWIASEDAVVPLLSLDSLEKQLSGEEKQLFIRFIRSMLKWLPEERSTAKQLLKDPWLL
ncbi:hypothetical protein V500_05005 [Pseudogymnoascus sp. VKM F-4518 (FW-2643)]|nr:hypothetical protein V500_05005 [Pseudogymnoascus sp. VKM F-4518 (FW-2643)]